MVAPGNEDLTAIFSGRNERLTVSHWELRTVGGVNDPGLPESGVRFLKFYQ